MFFSQNKIGSRVLVIPPLMLEQISSSSYLLRFSKIKWLHNPVSNFQSMKSPVQLNSLLSKFFCYITWLLYQLIRRESGRLAHEAFTSNPIFSSKQYLNGLKITNWINFNAKKVGLDTLPPAESTFSRNSVS